MDTLKKCVSVSGSEPSLELQKIAQTFEDNKFTDATSEVHSLRGL